MQTKLQTETNALDYEKIYFLYIDRNRDLCQYSSLFR